MLEAGNGFRSVALAAGDLGSALVQVSGLAWMTANTSQAFIKLQPPVGVSQVFSAPNFFGNR